MRLFRYIEDFRAEMNEKLDEKASQSSVDHILEALDSHAAAIEDHEAEIAALRHSQQRLEQKLQAL